MMPQMDETGNPLGWVFDTTTRQAPEYLTDGRTEIIEYAKQADRHTLRLLQKFIRSLESR